MILVSGEAKIELGKGNKNLQTPVPPKLWPYFYKHLDITKLH